jgi:eukaryotic-like serine/threonine-protein kinase
MRGDLDWIAMKALEKDRTRRYKTAHAFALDIQRYLANEVISARPPSKSYRLQKTIARNKLLFASVSAISLMLVLGLVVVSVALAREKQSRAKSEQVTKFLEAMLNGVGPSVALGEDTKMLRRILDQTAERVGKEMADQPVIEAELRNIIGKLYEELGDSGQGEKMVRSALAIRQKEFGPESLEMAESLNLLGLQLMAQRKPIEAERAHRQALAIRRRILGDERAETAASLNDLAAAHGQTGNVAEAETMVREALRIRRKLFGTQHFEVADSLRNLCIIQGAAGRWADAEKTAREALEMKRNLLPREHPWLASALEDHAWALNALDRFDEAQALDEEALTMRQKLLGDAHPDVSRNLNALGQLLGKQGKLQASEGVLKAALSIQRKMFGEDNQAVLETLYSLAKTLHDEGKRTEAESVWREAIAGWAKRGDDDAPDRLYALRGLGETFEQDGKWAEAEQLWRESLSCWRRRGGAEERQSMYTLRKLGLALEAQHKWPETELVQREALAISRKKGDEDSEALVDLERLVRTLLSQKKFIEAQGLLDRILTPAFIVKPASVNLLDLRAGVMGRRGRWREAIENVRLGLEIQLTDHYRYHTLAALLTMIGDRPGYEELCKKLVTKFADTDNPYIAERIAQDNLLLPESGADLALMDKLADKAVVAGSGTDDLPYFQVCKAMSQYRLGNFPEAIAWGNKAAKSSISFAQGKANAIVAMAHWQLRQTDEARAALARGETACPAISPEHGVEDLGESWVAWLMARVSIDEASRLVQDGSKTN